MIRKKTVSLLLAVALVLTGLSVANTASYDSAAADHSGLMFSGDIPSPTPTPGESTDSGVSGGGNGGG
jgi:hypothetical protein